MKSEKAKPLTYTCKPMPTTDYKKDFHTDITIKNPLAIC